MKSIAFEKQLPILNDTTVVFRKYDYTEPEVYSDGSRGLSSLLALHVHRHIKIELSYFDKNKQRYAAAALTESMTEDILELLFNGNTVTIESNTYKLPKQSVRPRYRYDIVRVPPQIWHAEKAFRDKKIADFKNYRVNRLNFDHVTALCEKLTLDGMRSNPKYTVICKNPVVWYNASAEYQFYSTLSNYKPLTPVEQAEYDAEARYFGAPDPTLCWHIDSRAIGLSSRKPVDPNSAEEKYVYSNEICRDMSNFQSIYVTAGTNNESRQDLVFAQKKYTTTHPALLRESYDYFRFIKDTFGDAGLLADYARCPHCKEIYHISAPCECFVERQARAQDIFIECQQLVIQGLLKTEEDVKAHLKNKYNMTLIQLSDDRDGMAALETKPDMSYYSYGGSHDTEDFDDPTDDIDFDFSVFEEDLEPLELM